MLADAKIRSANICQRVSLTNEELLLCLRDQRAGEAEPYSRPFTVSEERQVATHAGPRIAAKCSAWLSQNAMASTAARNNAALSSLKEMLPERYPLLFARGDHILTLRSCILARLSAPVQAGSYSSCHTPGSLEAATEAFLAECKAGASTPQLMPAYGRLVRGARVCLCAWAPAHLGPLPNHVRAEV